MVSRCEGRGGLWEAYLVRARALVRPGFLNVETSVIPLPALPSRILPAVLCIALGNAPLPARASAPGAFPATVQVSGSSRIELGSVPDGHSGVLSFCQVDGALFVARRATDGSAAARWPAGGRMIGTQFVGSQRPSLIADGTGGAYVAWHALLRGTPWRVRLMLAHVAASGTSADGIRSDDAREIGATPDRNEWVGSSSIALAPDGGVWVAWGSSVATDDAIAAGDYRLARLMANGTPAAGWDARGIVLGTYPGDRLNLSPDWSAEPGMSLVGVAPDGAGGAYVLRGEASDPLSGSLSIEPRLLRFEPGGRPAAGWPAAGIAPALWSEPIRFDHGAAASFRLLADGSGGVFAWSRLDARGGMEAVHFGATGTVVTCAECAGNGTSGELAIVH